MQYLLGAQCEQIFVKADVCFLLSPEISFVLKFCRKEIIKKHKKFHQVFKYFKMHLEYTQFIGSRFTMVQVLLISLSEHYLREMDWSYMR